METQACFAPGNPKAPRYDCSILFFSSSRWVNPGSSVSWAVIWVSVVTIAPVRHVELNPWDSMKQTFIPYQEPWVLDYQPWKNHEWGSSWSRCYTMYLLPRTILKKKSYGLMNVDVRVYNVLGKWWTWEPRVPGGVWRQKNSNASRRDWKTH